MNLDPFDPAALNELLATLRAQGVASARITATSVDVVFEPQFAGPLPGEAPTPGGWKSPPNLDAPSVFEPSPEVP